MSQNKKAKLYIQPLIYKQKRKWCIITSQHCGDGNEKKYRRESHFVSANLQNIYS